jgi:hypothetical protein
MTTNQKSQGDQSPNVSAGGDVNINFGKNEGDRSEERQTHQSQQRTAVKIALIGAAATIFAALIGLGTQCSETSNSQGTSKSASAGTGVANSGNQVFGDQVTIIASPERKEP